MDQLLENPQAIFLLVFMAIAFLKFIGNHLKGGNAEEAEEELQDSFGYESAREQILEEQRTSDPPPVPTGEQPSRDAPEQLSILDFIVPAETRGTQKSAPPPLPAVPSRASVKTKTKSIPSARPKAKPTLSPAEVKALEQVRKGQAGVVRRKRPMRRRPIREQLATPTAARDAIILGEILGPPKGQQRFSKLGPLDNV